MSCFEGDGISIKIFDYVDVFLQLGSMFISFQRMELWNMFLD